MRITDTKLPAGLSALRRRVGSGTATGGETVAPRSISDVTSVMGIPEGELTPRVQEAITELMSEVDRMRSQSEEMRQRMALLEQLADQDTLVPLANRRAFVRELSRVLSYSERYETPSSIIFFDVNGLKKINDTHGHAAGDAALLLVARKLQDNVRESDLVARLGGDEFGVLLTNTDETKAREKAAHLQELVQQAPLEWRSEHIPLRLATGTHTLEPGESPKDALAAADREMYADKNEARVRVAS